MKTLALFLFGAILCPAALAQQSITPADIADLPDSFTTTYATNAAYKVTMEARDGSEQVLEVPRGTRLTVHGRLQQNQHVRGDSGLPHVFSGNLLIRTREQTSGQVLSEIELEDSNVLVERIELKDSNVPFERLPE